ncbi:MAG: phosphatidate cytidylyltransferase [Gammaproteobacteria bacterium]|nr:phosphatidate cytidylyltransferase [Gammaproteobacteria bacterium]
MNEALRARIVTALLLAALVIVVLLQMPAQVAVVLISVAIFIAGYEWAGFAKLATRSSRVSYAAAILLALAGAESLADDPRWLEWILRGAALWWLLAFAWLAVRAKAGGRLAAAGAGFIVLVPAGIALSRLVTLQPDGRLLLLYLLVLIAAADVGAYFGGRRFGRRKLAPHVSPGKTWEGFAAGMLAAAAVAVAGAILFDKPLWPWLFLCELVALVSVVGDLTESMFKRQVGLKDSGRLLPGHGGILDRIDSLTAAAPTFLLGLLVLGLQP